MKKNGVLHSRQSRKEMFLTIEDRIQKGIRIRVCPCPSSHTSNFQNFPATPRRHCTSLVKQNNLTPMRKRIPVLGAGPGGKPWVPVDAFVHHCRIFSTLFSSFIVVKNKQFLYSLNFIEFHRKLFQTSNNGPLGNIQLCY